MGTRYFCDTDCELWYTEVDELGVEVIQMPYILDGIQYPYDFGRQTDFEHFYKRVREGATPTTAALNEYDYEQYFKPVFEAGDDIFYIAFSSKMSATFDPMFKVVNQLKEEFPERKFIYFDTLSISMGAGIQVYYALKLRNAGATDEEVLNFLQGFVNNAHCCFCVDSLKHLHRGGRLSSFAAFVGGLLQLKPIIKVNNEGKLEVFSKAKGTKAAIRALTKEVTDLSMDLDKYDVWIMHADCIENAKILENEIKLATDGKANTRITMVGPVIGAHCGAGTLGVIFCAKHR